MYNVNVNAYYNINYNVNAFKFTYNTHLHLFHTLCNKIDIDPKDPNSNFALKAHTS
jgi:hypothetical protein